MKRALKKRVKVVLENIPNENAQTRQQNAANQAVNRRVRKSAAMIGLAISMGATSLLVTRQSDQAQAAEPVGNQNTASSLNAATEAQVKFPTQQLESTAVSNASVPESPVKVDGNRTSQVSGLGAKWQSPTTGISRGFSRQVPTPVVPTVTGSKTNSIYPQSQLATVVNRTGFNYNSLEQTRKLSETVPAAIQVTTPVISTATTSSPMDAQLKAQQEFALNRLQEKSNRLRNSLAEWRSGENKGVSVATTSLAQPKLVTNQVVANQAPIANQTPTVSAFANDVQQGEINEAKSAKLLSRLKQNQAASTTPEMAAQSPAVTTSSNTIHEVKPGDTLARIASLYGTSVSELAKANNLSNANRLQVSQKLTIPVATAATVQATVQPTIVATSPTDVSGSSIEQSTQTTVQNTVGTNTTVASESPVVANNSPNVSSTTVTGNSQTNIATQPSTVQGTETTVTTKNTNTANNFTGMGGDTPVPVALNGMQGNRQGSLLAQRAKEDKGLLSLQEEIERLREKYRAQQNGGSTSNSNSVVVPTYPQANTAVPITVPAPYQQARPINVPTVPRANNVNTPTPLPRQNSVAVPIVVAPPARFNNLYPAPLPRANQTAIPISVPRPMQGTANEPFNPQWNSNTPNARMPLPRGMQDASQSLGAARGTMVSPQLPNSVQRLPNTLATVDRYLPQVIDENSPTTNRAGMIWPAKGVLTSGFGMRWGRPHRGIDIAGPVGTPIYAAADGVVERAGWNNGGYGKLVDIRHPDGTMTRYGHNSRILVQAGQQVRQGQQITLMGSTGFSTGPHLHFEIHPGGKGAVNPIAFLPPRV